MSKISLVILVTLCFQICIAQEEKVLLEKPIVDKRVELLSIVFRLAEADAYSFQDFKLYVDKIEQYFGKYKDHELIQYTKSIVKENGTNWDAVMTMAIHLDDNMELMAGVNDVWPANGQWSQESAEKFVLLLKQFVKDTKFDIFFRNNTDLYTAAVDRFMHICEKVDLNWYSSFFRKESSDEFFIIIGIGNGPSCYGQVLEYADGKRTVYAIMGAWETDNEGMPVWDRHLPYSDTSVLAILLHEFNHSFVNYLTDKYENSFRKCGENILSCIRTQEARAGGYDWKTMLNEALVRASVIKYMKDHDFAESEIDTEIKTHKEWWGFFWLEELVSELENYDRQRDIYPTLDSYMPKLAEFYTILSEKNLKNTLSNE